MTDVSSLSLDQLRQIIQARRVAIIGLGDRNLADDGVGPKLVERLRGRVNALTYEAMHSLQTVLSSIPADRPQVVVVVKSVDMGIKPGETVLFTEDMLDNNGIGEHARDVRLLMRYIEKESHVPAVLLIVQPREATLSTRLSEEVYNSCRQLEDFFLSTLGRRNG
jgi:hydrogenase maturation protease